MTGKQKAAMLLVSLDAGTATELLKGLPPEDVKEITMELVHLDRSGGQDAKEEIKVTQEFCDSLQKQTQRFNIRGFLNEMLVKIIGREKAEEIKSEIRRVTERRDSFEAIRAASRDELVLALSGEHPQSIAVVLSELDAKKSQEVLSLLDEESQRKAVCKMTSLDQLRSGVKERVASMVTERLKFVKGETLAEGPEQTLRKLALLLGGLKKDLRDRLVDEVRNRDEEMGRMVRNLMVTWEDIGDIADRSLQEALRSVESSKLAIALYGADESIAQKIRANISERAVEMLNEEISLMQEPLEREILEAREEIVEPLRQANEQGTLRFVGGK
jgi:flagellar motor switch protein FliG